MRDTLTEATGPDTSGNIVRPPRMTRKYAGLALVAACLLVATGCGSGDDGEPADVDTNYYPGGDEIDEAVTEAGRDLMYQEGLLDEAGKPVAHQLVDLSTADGGPDRFLVVGDVAGDADSSTEAHSFVRFGWITNRNGQEITTISQFPLQTHNNKVQIVVDENPEKLHTVNYTYEDSVYTNLADSDGSCVNEVADSAPSQEAANSEAISTCISTVPFTTLAEYIGYANTVTITVTQGERASLIAHPNNG